MDRYQYIIQFHHSLLYDSGFTRNAEMEILTTLKSKLDKAMYLGHKTMLPQHFQIGVKGASLLGEIDFKFHYTYNQEVERLDLDFITSKIRGHKAAIEIEGNRLPSFKRVRQEVVRFVRLKEARNRLQKCEPGHKGVRNRQKGISGV